MQFPIIALIGVLALGCHDSGGDSGPAGLQLEGTVWFGTWVSGTNPGFAGNVTVEIDGQGPFRNGTATLVGTASMTSSPCVKGERVFSGATWGTKVVGIIEGPDQVDVDASFAGQAANGTYRVASGSCAGDDGTLSLRRSVPAVVGMRRTMVLKKTGEIIGDVNEVLVVDRVH